MRSIQPSSSLTLDELVASDAVEAVLVCTRTSEHADLAIEVLRSGKHLLLEKPGAITLPEQTRIADEALAHPDLVARVAYMRRHDSAFRELARLIAAGAIGEPFALKMASREDFPPSDDDLAAGGFIMDVGVHDFDTARWLLGKDPRHRLHARAQPGVPRCGPRQRVHHDRPWTARSPRPTSRAPRRSAWTSAARWSGPTGRSSSPRLP